MALWLTRLGVPVRIVDKIAEPSTTSRALAVQARSLEFYRQIGLADAVLSSGRQVTAANMWVGYVALAAAAQSATVLASLSRHAGDPLSREHQPAAPN